MRISMDQAAERLGVSKPTILNLVAAGRIRRHQVSGSADVHSDDVSAEEERRRRSALSRHPDLVPLAEQAVGIIRPVRMIGGHLGGVDAIKLLSADTRSIFGLSALRAACRSSDIPCRTCWARMGASVYGSLTVPQSTQAWGILLGQPCSLDEAFWAANEAAVDARERKWAADSQDRDRKLKAMQAKLRAQEGERLISEGKRLLGPSALTASTTWTPVNETESAMLQSARRKRIDEQLEAAIARKDHVHALRLREMRDSL